MGNNLLAADVWRTVGSVALAILILLIMITVHEFGHWVAGKILKFKIDEFSIGFGPALFKHKSKKTGETFALRLIPLGGFCAFHGEDGLEEQEADSPPEPFAEIENGGDHIELTASFEEEAGGGNAADEPPMPEDTGKRKRRVPEWKQKEDDGSFTRKAPWKRIIVLLAGATMNYLLALVLIVALFFGYGQTMTAVYEAEPTNEIPAEYCLRDKDIFLKANGKYLYLPADLARAVNGKKAGDKVELYVSRLYIDEIRVNEEGEEEIVKSHREKENVTVILRDDVTVKNSSDLSSAWKALGIRYVEDGDNSGYALAYSYAKFGFFETLGRSFVYSWKIAGSIFRVLGELLTGRIGISSFGGPISTISVTAQAATMGFSSFLSIAALIGVNLAVFNLLPIPALDGSKIVFTVIEWIRGKPISRKIEAIIHAVGFVLLLGFAVLVDILQFVI